jgi:uncharacterized protein YihD (DUF1040 family)
MRDKKRIPIILKELEELWLKNSDMRLGQLLENYVFFSGQRGDETSVHLFYQEDDLTLAILKQRNNPTKIKLANINKKVREFNKGLNDE